MRVSPYFTKDHLFLADEVFILENEDVTVEECLHYGFHSEKPEDGKIVYGCVECDED